MALKEPSLDPTALESLNLHLPCTQDCMVTGDIVIEPEEETLVYVPPLPPPLMFADFAANARVETTL